MSHFLIPSEICFLLVKTHKLRTTGLQHKETKSTGFIPSEIWPAGVLSGLHTVPFADVRMPEEEEEIWGEYPVFGVFYLFIWKEVWSI